MTRASGLLQGIPGALRSAQSARTSAGDRGYADAMLDRDGCTVENWLEAPYNRWSFWHVREMTRTATIRRGTGPVRELPEAPRPDLADMTYEFGGKQRTLGQGLADNWADAFLVIHDGKIVYEWYVDGAGPADAHLTLSAAKSHTALLCGVLVGKGLLATDDLVTDHLPELADTAWEGCRVQHLLDMRGGTKWDYLRDEWEDMYVAGWVPHDRTDLPVGTEAWIKAADNDMEHGTGPFRYCSLQTAVLGWICERAGGGRFSDLFSREIWSKIGAEYDADIVVDPLGFQGTNGTMSMTLRDWGRLGLMLLGNGQAMGQQVVPAAWLARLRVSDPEVIAAYNATWGLDPGWPTTCYHDQWWITDTEAGIYSASGANGQSLMVHHPSDTVLVTFSTFPTWLEHDEFDHLWTQHIAVANALAP
jgi:CubicO group peptidase (beta-lactamase class C family)